MGTVRGRLAPIDCQAIQRWKKPQLYTLTPFANSLRQLERSVTNPYTRQELDG